jgi:hypothetical protein
MSAVDPGAHFDSANRLDLSRELERFLDGVGLDREHRHLGRRKCSGLAVAPTAAGGEQEEPRGEGYTANTDVGTALYLVVAAVCAPR